MGIMHFVVLTCYEDGGKIAIRDDQILSFKRFKVKTETGRTVGYTEISMQDGRYVNVKESIDRIIGTQEKSAFMGKLPHEINLSSTRGLKQGGKSERK